MERDTDVLGIATRFLRDEVAPRAQEIDLSPDALRDALKGLCRYELMALRRPEAYGGPAVKEEVFRKFQEEVARTSGALAFLQTQHQSAGSMLVKSTNEALKTDYLPKMGNGERLVGIGFSQLRRSGPPVMRAEEVEGGYRLDGHVPWITGWSFFPEFLIGAALPDGRAVFAVVPLENRSAGEASIFVSAPMKLAAMESAMTVTADFTRWFVPVEKVAFVQGEDWIKNNDMINIALQGHFALGCARAGLDVLQTAAQKRNLTFLHDAYTRLDDELTECQDETARAQNAVGMADAPDPEEATTQWRLNVRAWAIDLAVRCAHAAVTASSGAANALSHPAQRIYREALVYTVSAQTVPIMEATMRRLAGRTQVHALR